MRRLFISVTGLLLVHCSVLNAEPAIDAAPNATAPRETMSRVREGIELLNRTYWSRAISIWFDHDDPRGYFEGRNNPPWWPSANAVELLIDWMNLSGTTEYDADIGALYELQKNPKEKRARLVAELTRRHQWSSEDEQQLQSRMQKEEAAKKAEPPKGTNDAGQSSAQYYTDFQNEYLDDSGWWGIAWLKMYNRTKAAKYLATARTIHAHMAKNWRPDKGGGILWCENEDKQQPNAITNSLFLILSARLYQRTREPEYLVWAEKTVAWIHSTALYDGIAVADAPGHKGDYWSYNQGAFIGGLCALYQATGKREYLDEAVKAAKSALGRGGFTLPDGVVVERIGTGGDAALFKGIFVRYLAQLRWILQTRKLYPETAIEVDRCIQASAASILKYGVGPGGLYMAEWQEGAKDRREDFNTQLSAVIALLASCQASMR